MTGEVTARENSRRGVNCKLKLQKGALLSVYCAAYCGTQLFPLTKFPHQPLHPTIRGQDSGQQIKQIKVRCRRCKIQFRTAAR
uniref:Uncharacterized protein n=1 Tax=Arundo donax TaxID=35708 RepID=A0A0A8Y0K1_ARUDO